VPDHAITAEFAGAGQRGRRVVSLFGAGVLLAALSAGLTTLEWTCVSGGTPYSVPVGAIVLVDGNGLADRRVVVELAVRSIPIVAVGSVRRPLSMIAAVQAGATDVVDADLPFVDLLDAVVWALVRRPSTSGRATRRRRLLDALHHRQRDEQLLGSLTDREQQVLRALAVGRSAGEIAVAERLSVATVRSHIQAVLRKLEVSSQLAAVAVGRRGWRELGLADQQL
jgi:DNA-binding NarL/FixJ family response regulator